MLIWGGMCFTYGATWVVTRWLVREVLLSTNLHMTPGTGLYFAASACQGAPNPGLTTCSVLIHWIGADNDIPEPVKLVIKGMVRRNVGQQKVPPFVYSRGAATILSG